MSRGLDCPVPWTGIQPLDMRPIFVIAEPEAEQALSVRKLVIETAKSNVITAHSAKEMMESVRRFPEVHAVIIHSGIRGNLTKMIKDVRAVVADKPIIMLSPSNSLLRQADHTVSSHDPEELVDLLRKLFGDPRQHAA